MIVGDMEIRLRADIARLQRDMTAARETVTTATNGMARAADAAKTALAGIGLGAGLAQVIQMSDQYTKFTAQLKLATQSQREYAQALADVKRISTDAQSSMAGAGTLYARIANGTRELGTTQKQVADITETVSLALKVSGATAEESSSAMLQLSQSFASGTLRGEEFNAVNEAAPRLMKALADGIGVPIGALKQMASNGEITSKIMADTLPKALASLREESSQVQTIGGAFQVLKDRVMEFTAVHAQANGTVSVLTTGIGLLANNLTLLMGVVSTLTAVKLGTWAAGWVASTYASIVANRALATSTLAAAVTSTEAAATITAAKFAEAAANTRATASELALTEARVVELRAAVLAADGAVALAIATNGLIPAQTRAIALADAHAASLAAQAIAGGAATTAAVASTAALEAQAVATTLAARAMGVLRGVMAFLGGPIGLIITLLGAAATAWAVYGDKAKASNDAAAATTEASTQEIVANLEKQNVKLRERLVLSKSYDLAGSADGGPEIERLAQMSAELDKLTTKQKEFAASGKQMDVGDQLHLVNVQGMYDNLKATIDTNKGLKAEVEKTGSASKDLIAVQERLTGVNKQYLDDLTKLQTALEKGAISQTEYTSMVSQLATETWKSSTAGKEAEKQSKAGTSAAKQEASAYATLVTAIGEKLAANKLELSGFNALTDSQKLTIKLDEAIASGKNKVSQAHIESARAKLVEVAAQEKLIEQNKFYQDQADENLKAAGAAIKSANDEADHNEELARNFGLTASAIEKITVARLEDQLAQATSEKGYTVEMAQIEALIDAKKRSASALGDLEAKEASKKLADQELDDQKKTWDSIEKTAHDTFVSIFDSGKSAFDRLRDTLKNGLLDLLYQMVIKKWVLNIGASVGLTSASGLAEAAGMAGGTGSSGATGLIGLAQTASSMYKAVTGGFTSMSTTVADAIQLGFDKVGLGGTFSSAAPSVDLATGITSNGAAASAAGTAASYAAGVMAGHYIGNAIAGQYSVAHGQTVTNIATVVGAAILGPIGGVVGGVVGGLFNRAFGMGNKEVTATGMSGTLSDAGLSGSNYQKWKQDGGWFRSDKSGTDRTAFDPAVTAQFVQGFAAIKAASAGFAASIGASSDSLAGYSKAFDIKLTSDAAANEKAITDFFTGVGDEIALRLVPGLAQFNRSGETMATTLQRLAGDFDATNQVAMLLGKNGTSMFGSLTISSAAARERLIDLAGGVSNLTSQATAFAQNYLTEAERLAPVSQAVAAAMASLGLASVTTREQFKNVVQGLDVTTAAGAQQFASLMALSDAFAQVHPAIEATTAALRTEADVLNERKDLQKQVDQLTLTSAQLRAKERAGIDATNLAMFDMVTNLQTIAATSDTLKASISSLKAFRDGILSFKDSLTLGSLSTLTPMQKAIEAQRQYEDMLAKAKGGDSTAQAGIQAAATAYLTANQVINASSSAYVAASAKVQSDLAALAAIAGTQLTDAQQQLAAYDAQLSQLQALNATASGIEAALTMPTPVMSWTDVGTTNMAPLVDEIKGLRADNEQLRADNAALADAIQSQTVALVNATLTAAANNAAAVTAGVAQTAAAQSWKSQMVNEAAQ